MAESTSAPLPDMDELHWGSLRDWGQLVRLPNVFTLFSDCLAAAIVVGSFWRPLSALIPTMIASLGAYWAGMILNDIVDLDEDRQHRPQRPLAANRISPVIAGHVANGMLLLSPILVLATTNLHTSQALWMGAAFVSAVLLALAVRTYNSVLKETPIGPVLMGLCRSLNILMVGCSMFAVQPVATAGDESSPALQASNSTTGSVTENLDAESLASAISPELPTPVLLLAASIGLYIMGVTIYARREDGESQPGGLMFGLLLEMIGLILIGCIPMWAESERTWTLDPARSYPLLIGLIGLTVARCGIQGIMHPVSRKVQLAVRHAILTLILLDAAVVLMWAGPWFGCAVVALLLPALTSAVRFRST